jgi:hypothetical protein
MDGRGRIDGLASEIVDSGDDPGGVKMPFGEEAIGGKAAVKRAGGDAVETGDVAAGNGAEAIEIEMSVLNFKGIESPFDETDAAAEGVIPLEEFEETADATVAMGRENTGHVGVEIGSAIVKADDGLGETDEGVAIEGAEDLPAAVIGNDKGDVGLGLEFAVGPNLACDLDAAVEFL